MSEKISNIADWRVTMDGKDLSDRLRPRLVSLSISEKRGDEADQLDVVLNDTDGQLGIPKEGAVLHVQLGWRQGRDVAVGLIDKGSFKVDDVSHSGPPDQITIKARAAEGQWPVVGVLSCADSRVPVEMVFDEYIGRLFVELAVAIAAAVAFSAFTTSAAVAAQ